MKPSNQTLFPAMLLLFLCGCGQTGPLYLPGDPSEVRQSPTTQDDGENEDEADDGG